MCVTIGLKYNLAWKCVLEHINAFIKLFDCGLTVSKYHLLKLFVKNKTCRKTYHCSECAEEFKYLGGCRRCAQTTDSFVFFNVEDMVKGLLAKNCIQNNLKIGSKVYILEKNFYKLFCNQYYLKSTI